MSVMKAYWSACGVEEYNGNFDCESSKLVDIESRLFESISLLDVNRLLLCVENKDGSGIRCEYEKIGIVWVRVHSDNQLPNWFPFFVFCVLFPGMFFILYLIIKNA